MVSVTRIYEFAAAHRLNSLQLSAEENERVYGKCNRPHGHGHNYVLEVSVTGEVDERTGAAADIGVVDRAVQESILDRFDHKHLDLDCEDFKERPSTAENIVRACWEHLRPSLGEIRLDRLLLRETSKSAFEYRGP